MDDAAFVELLNNELLSDDPSSPMYGWCEEVTEGVVNPAPPPRSRSKVARRRCAAAVGDSPSVPSNGDPCPRCSSGVDADRR